MNLTSSEYQKRFDEVRYKLFHLKRWHLKRKKSDAARIWRYIYQELIQIAEERHINFDDPILEINFYYKTNHFSVKTSKITHTYFKGFVIKGDDHEKVITEINSALIHYGLVLENANKNKRHPKSLPTFTAYHLKFLEP